MAFTVKGNLVDVHRKEIYPAEIVVDGERIRAIEPIAQADRLPYILPGFIDAHVHIESSMLIPSEFARLAVPHGTVATVSDPHEIANVSGMQGIDYMIANGSTVPFKFNFGAPSCVPATSFETAGAVIDAGQIEQLMRRDDILYLSEMMNFPGVLQHDPEVMKKIAAARKHNKPVDGHAPGLTGTDARDYINAGISTDHECFTLEEALGKLNYGMNILIREGSAAKNFEALAPLIESHPDKVMFCSDDKHPDSLVDGHINALCKRAAEKGFDLFNILQAACVNPVKHYKLKVGLLRVNDFADFILVNDLKNFEVMQTYINGTKVAANGRSLIQRKASAETKAVNNFSVSKKTPADFAVPSNDSAVIEVIAALDGQLITLKETAVPKVQMGNLVSDPANDILKIAVVNRYRDAPVATGFIRNFGLKKGAIASSVAHDSHNIVAVGVDDESICNAVNLIIDNKGGVSCADHGLQLVLGLPVAGLMSQADGYTVAKEYASIDQAAKALGATLSAPFMTLSFMALLVIPHLKLSDKGLFDGDQFRLL